MPGRCAATMSHLINPGVFCVASLQTAEVSDQGHDARQALARAAGMLCRGHRQSFGGDKFVQCAIAPVRIEIDRLEHQARGESVGQLREQSGGAGLGDDARSAPQWAYMIGNCHAAPASRCWSSSIRRRKSSYGRSTSMKPLETPFPTRRFSTRAAACCGRSSSRIPGAGRVHYSTP